MFSDLLGRTPTATELNTFSQQLTLGSTPGDITGEILAGIEYQTDLVDGYFPTYLRRSALSSEASFYVGQLQGSVRDEVVISELIGSDEYFNSIPFPEPAGFFVFAAASLMLMVRRRAGLAT
jgi:hypothetical protein